MTRRGSVGRSARSALLVLVPLVGLPGAARGAEPADGVYGRIDGDLDVSIGAGAGAARSGAGGAALARALFLGSAGPFAAWVEPLGSDAPRSIATGVELRPLFLARWGSNLERGPAVLDLTLDSIGLSAGPFWASRPGGGALDGPAGLEVAMGFEVPIGSRASGPWIGARGALRWRGDDFGARTTPFLDRGAWLALTLDWHFVVAAHIVDAGDVLRR